MEGLRLYVRVLRIPHKKRFVTLVVSGALNGILCGVTQGRLQAPREFPRMHQGGFVINYVLNVAPTFYDQRLEAAFAKFLRCPAARNSRPNYNRVKMVPANLVSRRRVA
jgi:hypothetical protein